jgi:hypothetical protein
MEPLDGSADGRVVVKRVLLGCLIAQACCLPAWAEEPPASDVGQKRWEAAAMSLATPVVMYGLLKTVPYAPIKGVTPVVYLMPLGTGAGQVYAGDVVRGALVGLGGFVVFFAAGSLTIGPSGPFRGQNPELIGYSALAAYGLWAAWDAYHAVDRAKQLTPSTLTGPPTGGPPILPFDPTGPR